MGMQSKRYYNIEGIRFLFALIIVYYHILHSNIMSYVNENNIYSRLQTMSNNAELIVECFFIVSGYFLFETFSNKSGQTFLSFALKKIFRLGPVLWFSILVGILVFSQKIYPAIFNSLFLQCIGLSLEYKGINWYVSPLFWASLFYFALLKNYENKRVNLFVLVLVYFSYLVNLSSLNGGFGRETVFGIVNLGLARGLAGVGLGYLIGVCQKNISGRVSFWGRIFKEKKPLKLTRYVVISVVECLSAVFLMHYFLLGGNYSNKFIVVIIFSVFFVCLINQCGVISQLLNRKFFVYIGRYSYCIYVMQQISFWTLQRTLWKTEIVDHPLICIGVSLLFCAGIGVITYYLVERPGMWVYSKIELASD